jgi:putative PIN family toxin of toxin-antitoxin system
MKRIVLDTNVIVSAMLSPNGNEGLVLRLALAGEFELCISPVVLVEYRKVLERPKLRVPAWKIEDLFSKLDSRAKLVHPSHTVGASPDESDNRFLECAEVADAEYLITGNKRHFPKVWEGTKIVNAREFLEQVVPL